MEDGGKQKNRALDAGWHDVETEDRYSDAWGADLWAQTDRDD